MNEFGTEFLIVRDMGGQASGGDTPAGLQSLPGAGDELVNVGA